MKNRILKNLLFVFLGFFAFSCQNDDFVEYKDGGFLQINNPYLYINTPVVQFQAGTPSYSISVDVINNAQNLRKIDVYSVFTDAVSGKKSNKVLLTTLDVPSGSRVTIEKALTYADLKKGLTVNGAPLPDDDKSLSVGSGWKLTFEGTTDFATEIMNGSINVGVLSRFAGIYKVVESHYYRIGVLTAQWDGATRFIGSVDDNTFSYNDHWGNFDWTGKSFNFDIDFQTNKITAPIIVPAYGIFAGSRHMTCATDEALFKEFDCKTFNVFEPNEASGAHRIKLVYGYFTNGSGPRAFYEILEKVK